MDAKPWTDAEVETEIAWLEKVQPCTRRLVATFRELLALRKEVERLKASPPASHVIPANPPLGPVVSGSMG